MKPLSRSAHRGLYILMLTVAGVVAVAGVLWTAATPDARAEASPGAPEAPYVNMPAIAPIGVRVDKYLDFPESAKGPLLDPARGTGHSSWVTVSI